MGQLELAKHLGNDSQASQVMGYGKETFYRFVRQHRIRVLITTGGFTGPKSVARHALPVSCTALGLEPALSRRLDPFPLLPLRGGCSVSRPRGLFLSFRALPPGC